MSTLYTLFSLVVEGATWAAGTLCLLRVAKKIGDDDFKHWIHWLTPVWAGASLVLVAAYSIEAFIAVYGASEYEGVSFTRQGSPLSQSSLFVQISLSIVLYLLPSILFSRRARQSIAVVYSITGLCFLSIIAVPRFEKAEPIQSTTAQRASRVADR
jgi:hypothetical protein